MYTPLIKQLFLSLLPLFISVITYSQVPCDPDERNFIKNIGSSGDDIATIVKRIGDEGYVVCWAKLVGSSYRAHIAMVDLCGEELWVKEYNTTEFMLPTGLIYEGGELYITTYKESGFKTALVKMDLSGNVIWSKVFGLSATYPRNGIPSADGNILYCGVSNCSPTLGGSDFYISKSTYTGVLLWNKRIGNNNNEFGHNVIEDSDGNILAIGYTRDYFPGISRILLTKLDPIGNEVWTKEYHNGGGESVGAFITQIGSFYYLSGYSNFGTISGNDAYIIKIDLDGNVIWSKFYGTSGFDGGLSLKEKDGLIYLSGIAESLTNGRDAFVASINPLDGAIIEYTSLGTPSDESNLFASDNFSVETDGFYGITSGPTGIEGGKDIIFYRFNSFADNCEPSDVVLSSIDAGMIGVPFTSLTSTAPWAFVSTTVAGSSFTSEDIFICRDLPCDLYGGFTTLIPPCYEDPVVFSDTVYFDSLGIAYHWNFGDGETTITYDSDFAYTYNEAGEFLVELIIEDTITGCTDTISQLIEVTAIPEIYCTDSLTFCLADSIYVNFDIHCLDEGEITFTPEADVYSSTDSTVIFLPGTDGFIYINVTVAGEIVLSDSVFITIDTTCCVSYPIIAHEVGPFCLDSEINFENESFSTSGTPIYTWSFLPDGIPSSYTGEIPPAITFSDPGEKLIILQMEDACGIFYDSVYIEIVPPPTLVLSDSLVICNSSYQLMGATSISPNCEYNWSPPANLSDPEILNPTAWIDEDINYTLTLTDTISGCVVEDSITFILDSVYVGIYAPLNYVCDPDEFLVTSVYYPGTGSLEWNLPDHLLTSGPSGATYYVDEQLTIVAKVTSSTGFCEYTDTLVVSLIPTLAPMQIDTTICEDDHFWYQPLSQWYINGNPITTFNISETGTYYYDEMNVCGEVTHKVSIHEKQCSCNIYVPNTVALDGVNTVFIPISDCLLNDYHLTIYDRWGEILFESYNQIVGWNASYGGVIVQDGVYIWTLTYKDPIEMTDRQLIGHVTVLN